MLVVFLLSQFQVDYLSFCSEKSLAVSFSYLRYSSKPEATWRKEIMNISDCQIISLVLYTSSIP